MTIHTVVQGENIDIIAFRYGFHPATLWEHDENQKLRDKRKDPNVLMAGDEVFIPDRELREEIVHTGKVHTFYRNMGKVREEEKKKKKKLKKKDKQKKKEKKGEEKKKKKKKKEKLKEKYKKKKRKKEKEKKKKARKRQKPRRSKKKKKIKKK